MHADEGLQDNCSALVHGCCSVMLLQATSVKLTEARYPHHQRRNVSACEGWVPSVRMDVTQRSQQLLLGLCTLPPASSQCCG